MLWFINFGRNLTYLQLIEPREGTDYSEIQRAVARLFYIDEIPEKNRIWVFREGPEKFSYEDLHKLKDAIKENYPRSLVFNLPVFDARHLQKKSLTLLPHCSIHYFHR